MRRCAAPFLVAFVMLGLGAGQARAVQPDEVLDDPKREQRARELSAELRCMVCQNQSIDDSDAELARDLRILVRERIEAGDTNEEVLDFVVSRYGEFVLLKPRFSARNALLWATPVILLLAGGVVAVSAMRKRGPAQKTALTPEEQARLEDMLNRRD